MTSDDWKRIIAGLLSAATLYFSADNNKQLAEHGGQIKALDSRVEVNSQRISELRSSEPLVRPKPKKKGGEE